MTNHGNCLLTVAIAFLMVGCATYEKPDYYVHLTEYGYLPVIDDGGTRDLMISYVAYDWYVYDGSTKGKHMGELGLAQRSSLPTTRDEAIAIVEKNFAMESEQAQSQATSQVMLAPVAVPFMLIYWAPGIAMISEHYAHRPDSGGEQDPLPELRSAPSAQSKMEEPVVSRALKIRIIDQQGHPIQKAEVLLLLSPIAFEAYAGERGHRTYPKRATHLFDISSELATLLADHLGAQYAPAGKLADDRGVTTITVEYLGDDPGNTSVMALVKKAGYRSKAVKIPLDQILSGRADHLIMLDKQRESGLVEGQNPWLVSRQLDKQVQFYMREYTKLVHSTLPSLPSLPWSEFEKLVIAASKVAPDYPVVQSARFFYELESGRPSEAKRYGRFIKDDVYVRAVHDLIWETGLRMR